MLALEVRPHPVVGVGAIRFLEMDRPACQPLQGLERRQQGRHRAMAMQAKIDVVSLASADENAWSVQARLEHVLAMCVVPADHKLQSGHERLPGTGLLGRAEMLGAQRDPFAGLIECQP